MIHLSINMHMVIYFLLQNKRFDVLLYVLSHIVFQAPKYCSLLNSHMRRIGVKM